MPNTIEVTGGERTVRDAQPGDIIQVCPDRLCYLVVSMDRQIPDARPGDQIWVAIEQRGPTCALSAHRVTESSRRTFREVDWKILPPGTRLVMETV